MNLEATSEKIKLEGIVKSKKYFNEKNNFYILTVSLSKKNDITVVGYGQDIKKHDCVSVLGVFKKSKYGEQFETDIINIVQPTKKETILEYLSSGIVKGLSKANAKELVRIYGDDSIRVLDQQPELLLRLNGIGEKKLNKIINSWHEVRPSEQTISELINLGYQHFEAIKIFKKFGSNSLTVARSSPYIIPRRIHTIDFEKVDAVALKIGLPFDSPQRILATLEHFLREKHKSGDCLIEYNSLYYECLNYLGVTHEALYEEINNAINGEYFFYYNIDDVGYLQYRTIKNAEDEIARRIYKIHKNNNHKKDDPDREYEIQDLTRKGEKKIPYSEEQLNAIKKSINSKFSIITGGPGVGKTTVLNEVLKQLKHLEKSVLLCAPTGKAAQKMTESTGFPAATIHRLLEFNPMQNGFQKNESEPLETDVIVIDESSMIDVFLMSNLLKAIHDDTMVIIVGDVDQLPSVQAGSVLRDIINSGLIPLSKLTVVRRQEGNSRIITNAYDVNSGNFDFDYKSDKITDFYYIESNSDESTFGKMKKVIEVMEDKFNINPKDGLQLLTPQHDGLVGTKNLNQQLQILLNESDSKTIKRGNFTYKVGDRIIQVVNNYDKNTFNGDCGVIDTINNKGILVKFDNGMEVEYEPNELDEILPSYCITIHKSQGSEYPAIIMTLPRKYAPLMDRSLIYTGITRGKKLVIIIGSKEVMKRSIASKQSRYRKTYLKEKMLNVFNTLNLNNKPQIYNF